MGIEQTLRSFMNILSSIIDESNVPNNNSRVSSNGHYSTDKTIKDESNGLKNPNGSRSSNGATTSPLLRGFLSSFSMGNGAECVFPTLSYASPQTSSSSIADQHDDNNSLSGANPLPHVNDDSNDDRVDGGHPYHVDEYSDRHPRKRKRRSFIYANNFLASLENLEAIGDSEQSEHHFSDPLPQSLLSLQPSHEEISTAMAREMRFYPEDERYDDIATVPHKLLRNAADVLERLIDIRVRIYVGILAQRKLEKGEGFSQSERDLLSYTNKEDGDKIPRVVFGESRFLVSPFAQSKVTEIGVGMDGVEESVEIKLPFTFMCTFEVKMRNAKKSIPLEIKSTGFVSGLFTANNSSFLKSVHLDIKTPQLVKSMMVQVDKCMGKMFRHVITPESPDPVEEIDPEFQDECDDVDFPYAVESAFACGAVVKTYDEHEVRRKAMENARAAMETAKAAAAAAAEKRFSLPPGRRLSMGQVEKKLTERRHSAAQAERRRSANGFDRSSSAASAAIQRRNLGRRISLEGMDRNQMMERCVIAAQRLSSPGGGDMSNKRKLTMSQVERCLSEKRLKEHQEGEKKRGSAVAQNGGAQIAKNGITLPRGFGQNRTREESLLDHMEHRRIIAQKFMDKLTTPGMTEDNASSTSRRISIEPPRRNSYGQPQRRISMEPQRRQHERRATAEPLSLNNFSRNGLSMAEAIQRLGDYTEQEIDEDEMDRPVNTQAIFGPPTRRISMEATHVPRETVEQMEHLAEMDPGVKNLSMAEKVQRLSMAEAVQRSYDDAQNNHHPHPRRGSLRRGSAPGRRISLEPTDPRKRQRGNIRGMAEAVERLANELREEEDSAAAEDDNHDVEPMHSSAGGSHERMARRGSFVARRRPAIDAGRLDMGGTMALREGAPPGGDDDPAARKPPAERRSSYGRRRRISLEPVRRQSVNEPPMKNNNDHYSPGGGGNQRRADDVDRGDDDSHNRAFAAASMGGDEDDHESSMNMSASSSVGRRRRRHSLQQPSQPSQQPMSQQQQPPSRHNGARPESSTQQPCANEQQPVEEDRANAERQRGRQRPGRRISIERMDPTVQGQFDD